MLEHQSWSGLSEQCLLKHTTEGAQCCVLQSCLGQWHEGALVPLAVPQKEAASAKSN